MNDGGCTANETNLVGIIIYIKPLPADIPPFVQLYVCGHLQHDADTAFVPRVTNARRRRLPCTLGFFFLHTFFCSRDIDFLDEGTSIENPP